MPIVEARRIKRFALVGAILAVLALCLVPIAAQADGYYQAYCGVLKGSGNWCGASGAHSWDLNHAYADGDPNRYVCQRIWNPNTALAIDQSCGYGDAWSANVNRTCACYGAHVAQFSGGNNYVWGQGWA